MRLHGKSGWMALLLSSVCATAAFAQNEITIGGLHDLNVGLRDAADAGSVDDARLRETTLDNGLTLSPRLVADNGITFATRVDLDDADISGEDIDKAFLFLSGDFGSLVIGEDNGTFPNQRITDTGGWGACGRSGEQAIRYDTPRFAGFSLGAQYSGDIGERRRGTLAYDLAGNFVNPAANFEYNLNGFEAGIAAGFCLDTGRILPTTFSLAVDWAGYKGSDQIANMNFPNLGVTGVGDIPGVLINTPTDIQSGYFDVDRQGYGFSLNFVQPFRINAQGVLERRVVTPSGSFWEPVNAGPSLGIVSVIGGLRYGMEEQSEDVRINANSPAFGASSAWTADYNTNFDTDRLGGYLGFRSTRSFAARNGATNTLGLTGTVGYDFYKIDVRDSVNATGLGGALSYNNINDTSHDDGVFTASLIGSYNWKRQNQSFQLSAGIEYGTAPEYDYARPDSDATGPLDPTLTLKPDVQFVVGASWAMRF